MTTKPQYTRIGDLWHCNECDEDLIGWWELAKHDWTHHYIKRINPFD